MEVRLYTKIMGCMCSGFDCLTWHHMWVEFVVGCVLALRGFVSRYYSFVLS